MGIPKFFRWISERYPLTSQLIEENKIPEFDNFYLDFNSIIHHCSHPNDGDAHFRLSEQQIYTAIFAYVDHLFSKIKPKKVFFMAVDGVAPRAKINQQRSRRFRTAKEAREAREAALRRGEKLPDEKAFDSNCITPGTSFMARVSAQLHYFVNKKISEDADWRGVQVILSGHEVPGEGEHKIMEYIRLSKAQPDYNPNTRHCLYGLDADLIMLGLLSHDPHFCLLREEVKFGPQSKKKSTSLDAQSFFLLHLALFREYLDLEFAILADPLLPNPLPFEYSLERVIDDFILLAIFIGNDFLPHLPDFHINENALEQLFEIYKLVLPQAGGYIVSSGTIDMGRLQLVLNEMAKGEVDTFMREAADQNYIRGKMSKYLTKAKEKTTNSDEVMTAQQRVIFERVKQWILNSRHHAPNDPPEASVSFVNDFPARDRTFIQKLASDLNLMITWDEYDEEDRNLATLFLPEAEDDDDDDDDDEGEWDDDPEAHAAVDRVLAKYEKSNVVDVGDADAFESREQARLNEGLQKWKDAYYREKLGFSGSDPQDVQKLVYRYCEGLQWVMYYYYSGVASWGWFYDYHYAPRISDFVGVDTMVFHFELGEPFKPFEQLMSVLPSLSKDLVSPAYQSLMYDWESPIIDFYPTEFEQDLNGKKNDWEAIIKIPFIDVERLRKAMKSREHQLTDEERQRNSWGNSTSFEYDSSEVRQYPSSLPGVFPLIARCYCKESAFDLPTLDGLHLVEGLCDGVFLGVEALAGFPSLKTLPHTAVLGYHHVNVFQSDSRNKSMVTNIRNTWEDRKTSDIAKELVGQRTFVNWPFLQEGLIEAISDDLFKYDKFHSTPHSPQELQAWKRKADRIEERYSKRCAVLTGDISLLLHVRPLKGLRRTETGALVKEYEGLEREVDQALQMAVMNVVSEDPRYIEKQATPLNEEYPAGTNVIFLGEHAYGVAARVESTSQTALSVILAFFPAERADVDNLAKLLKEKGIEDTYFPAFRVAETLRMTSLTLSKITSSFMVTTSGGDKKNIGLRLKFEGKSLKVLGYTRKSVRTWEYSEEAVKLIRDYKLAFPEVFQRLDANTGDISSAAALFPGKDADAQVKQIEAWLKTKGVRDFEAVSLQRAQMSKTTIAEVEAFGLALAANRRPEDIKKAIVKGIPPNAVLKPAHAMYRLQNQIFNVGDRVTMVQDSGSVPLCAKGVVIGLNADTIDVVWDVPFMSGTTLGDRCSPYRGSSVSFSTCLNLTRRQFVASTSPTARHPPANAPTSHPQRGGVPSRGGLVTNRGGAPVRIMANPNRGQANGHSRGYSNGRSSPVRNGSTSYSGATAPGPIPGMSLDRATTSPTPGQAHPPRGRGGFRGNAPPRGGAPAFRGGTPPLLNHLLPQPPARGRGGHFRGDHGNRGRGRGGNNSPRPRSTGTAVSSSN